MRGITLEPDAIRAEVTGANEVVDRIPTLTGIHVHYTLVIPSGAREVVDRALERHVSKCPTAVSLRGAVPVTWTADIREAEGVEGSGP